MQRKIDINIGAFAYCWKTELKKMDKLYAAWKQYQKLSSSGKIFLLLTCCLAVLPVASGRSTTVVLTATQGTPTDGVSTRQVPTSTDVKEANWQGSTLTDSAFSTESLTSKDSLGSETMMVQNMFSVENKLHSLKRRHTIKDSSENKRRRRRRHRRPHDAHSPALGIRQRSCPTTTLYAELTHAEDMYGNTVEVAPHIHVGGAVIKQNFYQSVCAKEKCRCRGIASMEFSSTCQTDYTFTYARVIMNGETGWRHIKVPVGCSCIIRRIFPTGIINIMDLIN